jgi:uncharacterized phage-associated protein
MLAARDVAEYFISILDLEAQDFLTNLKVQKLLYYAQGLALAYWSARLFPEKIIAWQLGPVVIEVYKDYEKFGGSPLSLSPNFSPDNYDKETKKLLKKVFDEYGKYSAGKLVDMTHNETPWKKTKINSEISIKHIQDFFKQFREF